MPRPTQTASPDQQQAARPPATRKPQSLQPGKLLRSKWTAVTPANREKHFIVTALLEPEPPGTAIDVITMEAVYTGRSFDLRWRELKDSSQWLRGWC